MSVRSLLLTLICLVVGIGVYIACAIPPGTQWGDHVDWGDVATWTSAVVTGGTVAVAAIAIRRDNERQNSAQRAEWDRIDAQIKRRTTILAKTFHLELYRASVEIKSVIACLDELSMQNVEDFKRQFAKGLSPNAFKTIDRFSLRLEGFDEMVSIGILNASSVWRNVPIFAEGISAQMPNSYLILQKKLIRGHLLEINSVFADLQIELEPYFADLKGVVRLTPDEVRAHNAARANES